MHEKLTQRIGRIIGTRLKDLGELLGIADSRTRMNNKKDLIDAAMEDVRSELGRVSVERHRCKKELADTRAKCEELLKESDTAVAKGRDEDAERPLSLLLDMEARKEMLETRLDELAELEVKLSIILPELVADKRKLTEHLEQSSKAKGGTRREGKKNGPSPLPDETDFTGSAELAEAFLRGLRGHGAISGMDAPGDTDPAFGDLVEVNDIVRKHRIEERLAAIKQRLKRGDG